MKQLAIQYALIVGLMAGAVSTASAETVKFDALVAQKDALRLDFADGSNHFFLLVHREGKSEGCNVRFWDLWIERTQARIAFRSAIASAV